MSATAAGEASRTAVALPPGPDEVVLDTVAVAPPVRGVRSAALAIRRHLAEPDLSAGPAPADRAAWGAAQLFRAARLVWHDRALRRAAKAPVLLTALGCGLLAALYTLREQHGFHPRAALQLYMTSFVALASMPPTLLQRQWIRVAHEARRALGLPAGEDPFAGASLAGVVAAEWVKALRQAAVVLVGFAPVVFAASFLPDSVHAPAAAAGLWGFYWVVVDAFELPLEVVPGPRGGGPEPWFARLLVRVGRSTWLLAPVAWAGRLGGRLARPWREELHFTEGHPWESAGMGLAAGILLSIPVIGLAFRAVAIVAATALLGRLGQPAHLPALPPRPRRRPS